MDVDATNPINVERGGPSVRRSEATLIALILSGVLLVMIVWASVGRRMGEPIPLERDPDRIYDVRVDINTASAAELVHLPGIGPTLANRIIEDRKRRGRFTKPHELARVRGIGPKLLERIEPFLAPMESPPAPR